MSRPFIIGITGGIGGGKSTLSDMLREKGYYVYDTDVEAKRIQNDNPEIKKSLIELFGNDVYTEGGELDRKKLALIVFNDSQKLAQLNKIVHPAVLHDLEQWIKKYKDEKLLFVESAIMFEIGWADKMDKVVVVTAPEDVRISRVMKRDRVSEEEVRSRIARQMPEEAKIAKADIVLNSDGYNVLRNNIEKLLADLEK